MGRFGVNRAFAECEACGHPRVAHFGGGCHCGCTRVSAAENSVGARGESNDIVEVLRTRIATINDSESDAWRLISEAAAMRREGRAEDALQTARRAREVAAADAERVAATTVIVASLCDLRRDEEARLEGEAALQMEASPYLLRALGRAWFLGYAATRVVDFRARADECFARADEIDAVPA